MKTLIANLAIILALWIAAIAYINNEYTINQPRECTVLQRYRTGPGYKVSERFILVLRDAKGRVFDKMVSPTEFYLSEKSSCIVLGVSESDIAPTFWGTGLFFIGPVLLMAVALITTGMIWFFYPVSFKKEEQKCSQ